MSYNLGKNDARSLKSPLGCVLNNFEITHSYFSSPIATTNTCLFEGNMHIVYNKKNNLGKVIKRNLEPSTNSQAMTNRSSLNSTPQT